MDDLLYRCIDFISKSDIALDQSDIEIFISLECKLAGLLYYGNAKQARKMKIRLLIDRVFTILQRISPAGCFFGIHPGDPGRIGFWPDPLRFEP